jgi:transposase
MKEIKLTKIERKELERISRAQAVSVAQSRRARLILLLAQGAKWVSIREKLGCDTRFMSRWRGRFIAERLAGLFSRHAGRASYKVDERLEAKILAWTTKRKPADGSTHWSSRKLAGELGGVSHMTVARVWAKHRLRPHRLERYMASNDPQFEAKAADIIGLYLNPPQHAAVFCVDEKTAIQALDRKDPVLPLSPGRAERHGFEYYRHGTLSLFAASTPARAMSWAKPLSATLRRSSWPSSLTSWPINPSVKRSTSSPIISPRTKPRRWRNSLLVIPTFICILPRRIPPGSIK